MSRRVTRHRGSFNRPRFSVPRAKSAIIVPTAVPLAFSHSDRTLLSLLGRLSALPLARGPPFPIFLPRSTFQESSTTRPPRSPSPFSFLLCSFAPVPSVLFVTLPPPFGLLVFTVNRAFCNCPGQRELAPGEREADNYALLRIFHRLFFGFVARGLFQRRPMNRSEFSVFLFPRRGFKGRGSFCSSEPIDFLPELFQLDRSSPKR